MDESGDGRPDPPRGRNRGRRSSGGGRGSLRLLSALNNSTQTQADTNISNETQNFRYGVHRVPFPESGHTLAYTKRSCDPKSVSAGVTPVSMNGRKAWNGPDGSHPGSGPLSCPSHGCYKWQSHPRRPKGWTHPGPGSPTSCPDSYFPCNGGRSDGQ